MSSVQYRIWCMKSIEPMLVIVIYHTIFLDLFSFQFLTGVAWELYLKQFPADGSEKQMEITCHDDNKESEELVELQNENAQLNLELCT